MKKRLLLFPLIFLMTYQIHSWPGQTFWSLLKQKFQYNINNYIDYGRVARIALQEWERIFKPGLQTGVIKKEIAELGNKISKEIKEALENLSPLSQDAAHYEAKRMVHYYGLTYIEAKVQDLCWSKLSRTPINPELLDKNNIVHTITMGIVKEAEQKLIHNQTLDEFLRNIEAKIDNELQLIYRPYLISYSSEIVELYPQTQSSLDEYHAKLERVKQYREDTCCVMGEEFGKGVKRVNLLCGHTICVNCLYQWMNSERPNAHTCPICRASIKNADFPSSFLEKHFH